MVSLISILTKYAFRQRGPRNCLWKVLPCILPQHRRPWYSPPSKLLISLIYLPCLLLICGVRISWCCFDIYFAGDSDIIKSLPGDHWEMLQFLELMKSLVVTLRIKLSFFFLVRKFIIKFEACTLYLNCVSMIFMGIKYLFCLLRSASRNFIWFHHFLDLVAKV